MLFWRNFDKHIPKENGWYQCTIRFETGLCDERGNKKYQTYVMNLYWYGDSGRFIDNIRQNVFDVYQVFSVANMNKRLTTIPLCDRTNDVIAWKKLPRPYKFYKKGVIT